MFTGIIQEVGKVNSVQRSGGNAVIRIGINSLPEDVKIGDSIAIDGVCLTVTQKTNNSFSAEAVEETLKRSTLGSLKDGSPVNVEYSLKLSDRLGGHFVQGHVDSVGTIRSLEELEGSTIYTITLPENVISFCIEKGSIAIDGISLTIAQINDNDIKVSVIPHSRSHTSIGYKGERDKVNVEVDMIGKYVRKFLGAKVESSGISEELLRDKGFI